MLYRKLFSVVCLTATTLLGQLTLASDVPQVGLQRLLYVAAPGIRDDLTFGGHGVLVFDVDHGHKFVRRIAFEGLDANGKPLNVKGIAANAQTTRLYVTTLEHLIAIDLASDRVLWQKSYEGGCDRLALAPDGATVYLPSLEKGFWHVVNAIDGRVLAKITTNSGAHNTIYGPDGSRVYLAGLKSPVLNIAETQHHTIEKTVGPFSNVIRPFTINGSQTLCFVNVNDRLGFEVGELQTGKVLCQVDVQDHKKGPVKMHGCPCHGIGLTPDGRELWLCDSFNRCIHVFDATQMPPRQVASIRLRDEPGWITMGIDGTFAYPSTGEVIDTKTRKIIATLRDEKGRDVRSEKLLEIDFDGTRVVRAGSQFGISDDQARARAILEKAIEAHGGKAVLGKFAAAYCKVAGNDFVDDKRIPRNFELHIQGDDKMRLAELDEAGKKAKSIEVINGQEGWLKEDSQPAMDISDQLESEGETIYTNWATMLVPLLKDGFRLSTVKEITVAGSKAEGILIAHGKHRPLKFYFDTKTHLLVKCERTLKKSESENEGTEETIWSDFQEIQGTRQAMKASILWDGVEVSEAKTTELKFYEKPLDEKLFAKP